MNKHLMFLILSTFILSCKQNQEEFPVTSFEAEMEMAKWDSLYSNFQEKQIELYEIALNNPSYVLKEIEKLLKAFEKDKNISSDLLYFKAEILYNTGEYQKSLEVLKSNNFLIDVDIPIICNYVKIGDYENAKLLIDKNFKHFSSFDQFIYANYLETIDKKDAALEKYNRIIKDSSNNRFFYYTLADKRVIELKRNNPILLEDVYFPTGNPNFKETIN
jgi:hypothetical protein